MKFLLFFSLIIPLVFSSTDHECPNVLSPPEDRRQNKNSLRIVQFNVEWLFIDYYSAANCPGSGCTWVNSSEANIHMEYVSKVVDELRPDIINLCEVEGCDELDILKNKLTDNLLYQYYLKKGTDTSTGQNVGMLTRIDPIIDLYRNETKYDYPIPQSECGYSVLGTTGVSKHYITEFALNNYNIAFISAHLIAIPNDPSRCSQREAQATILHNIIRDYVDKNYEVIMLGDFNDYDGNVSDINNNQPTSKVLEILKGLDDYKLFSVTENIEQQERYSDWWDSDNNCHTTSQQDYSMIDHILVTEKIKKDIYNVFIYHGYDEYCGKYNSDHFPFVIDIITN